MKMSEEFNPDAIMNSTITADEYDGKRALVPEGAYPDSTIMSIKTYEPHEEAKAKGVEARLLMIFDCPDYDGDLSTYMNFKKPLHPKATYTKLFKAVFTDKEVATTKTVNDLIGETVNINVFHEEGDKSRYAEFRFTPVS